MRLEKKQFDIKNAYEKRLKLLILAIQHASLYLIKVSPVATEELLHRLRDKER